MVKLSLALPILLSLYAPLSQAENYLPECALTCLGDTAKSVGCHADSADCVCRNKTFAQAMSVCMVKGCSSSDLELARYIVVAACGAGMAPSPYQDS